LKNRAQQICMRACFGMWFLAVGCSPLIEKYEEHGERNARKVIYVGNTRSEIVAKLGAPQTSQENGGKVTDIYLIPAHMNGVDDQEAQKSVAMADMFFCLACPLDLAIAVAEVHRYRQNKCEYQLRYDADQRLASYQCFARLICSAEVCSCPSECATTASQPPSR